MENESRVPTDELRAALGQALERRFGAPRRIRKLRRRVSAYASSCAIENIDVALERGGRLNLVFKDLSPGARLKTADHVRPSFLYRPAREIEVYQRRLGRHRSGTATFYGAVVDEPRQRYWLFLERVRGRLLWQFGRLGVWESAARWLRRWHSLNEGMCLTPPRSMAGLLQYDAAFYRLWPERAVEHLRRNPAMGDRDGRRAFARMAERYERVVRSLCDLPRTLIHGECYPSNVIVRAGGARERICPIDWELAAVGPGAMDLAALTAGEWTETQRSSMIAAYRGAGLRREGGAWTVEDLVEAVDCCQLHQAVQMLGWAPNWTPPAPHAKNWLREALRLAKRLGV